MSKNAYAKSAWSDHVPVDRIDPELFLYMGADPCWTPSKEFKASDAPDAAAGCCSLCGGDVPDSLISSGSHRVCARCMKSGRGDRSQAAPGHVEVSDPEVPVPCPDDPGYVERDGVKVPERFARKMRG